MELIFGELFFRAVSPRPNWFVLHDLADTDNFLLTRDAVDKSLRYKNVSEKLPLMLLIWFHQLQMAPLVPVDGLLSYSLLKNVLLT